MKTKCPACESLRIIHVRHDVDWGGGHDLSPINQPEDYLAWDLSEEGEVTGFGDIDLYACLACDYVWQRYGSFVLK